VFLLERTTVEPNSFIAFKSVYGMALAGEMDGHVAVHIMQCRESAVWRLGYVRAS
jgi:hypothetical protein